DTGKQSGHNATVGIRKDGAQENAASVRVQTIIKRLEVAAVREVRFVGELQFYGNPSVAVGLDFLGLRQGVKFQERVLVNVRIRVDRVHRHQGREQRRSTGDAVDVVT